MPRKPTSIFLIVEPPANATAPNSQLSVQRIPIYDDLEPKDIAAQHYGQAPAGTTFYIVEDTKVEAHTVSLVLEPIDDPRLDQDEEDNT